MLRSETPEPSLIAVKITAFQNIKTIAGTHEMYAYDKINGIWKSGAEDLIRALIRKDYPRHNSTTRNEVVNFIQDVTFINREDFDNHKPDHLVPLSNYLIDVTTLGGSEYKPEYYYTFKFPYKYDSQARCPKFLKFLKDVLPNRPKDIIRVLEGFATGLIPQLKFEKAYMFVGTRAQNGKSTLFNIMATVLGSENIANVSIHDLKFGRFSRAELIDKSYNIYADINSKAMRELGIIKMIISGDPMMVERKNQQPFSYSPRCKLFFSSNQPPIIDEDNNAVYRRFFLIEFPVEFKKHDPLFEKKFEDEYDGIMTLLVRLAAWIYRTKKLRYEQSPEELRLIWDLKANPISKFIDEGLIRKQGATIEHGDMYKAYTDYCRKNHFTAELMNTFTKLMKKKGMQQRKTNSKLIWLEWELKDRPEEQEKLDEDSRY